ncbi:multicopper oxidase domain-containing protein [Sporosarcina sp.]|uniref:multicopper oxidase family protein n=1 Tax=Sporosarcina sp. TaxID=49982 RepID=UPI00260E782A|nr:multicopper oxidase domain-containing protein [Sporosarcina sp.]
MRRIKLPILALSLFVIGGCSTNNSAPDKAVEESPKHHMMEGMDHSDMMEGHMSHDQEVRLNDSTGTNELKLPPVLERNADSEALYTVRAQEGKTEIIEGAESETFGYNGSFLGPMLRFERGETVKIRTINELDEDTTFHWHGLEVPGEGDGGPHAVLKPGEEKVIEFKVDQEASTLWFHPHPEGKTAEQVYKGMAGLIYIEDQNSTDLRLPDEYGQNDIPLIFQDRSFDDANQLNYSTARNDDGTIGDTLLINGTVNPKLTVKKEKIRLRLLNGSNARNYKFKLNTGDSFVQVATDGGFLNAPVSLTEVTLTPSERAEIIIDFSKLNTENDFELVDDEGSVLLPFVFSGEVEADTEVPESMNQFALTEEEKALPVTKKIELFGMMDMVTINGKKFNPDRIDLTQKQGVTEVWEIYNKPDMMGGMIHPFHIHGTQFKIISRNGEAPPENELGWKDSISVAPDEKVKIAIQFKHKGVYMYHCHILEHEDNGMMGQIKVE